MHNTTSKLFECALGCHEFTIPYEGNSNIKICKNCRKKGYLEINGVGTALYDFNEDGECVYYITSGGYEYQADNKGCLLCIKRR